MGGKREGVGVVYFINTQEKDAKAGFACGVRQTSTVKRGKTGAQQGLKGLTIRLGRNEISKGEKRKRRRVKRDPSEAHARTAWGYQFPGQLASGKILRGKDADRQEIVGGKEE